MKDSPDVEQLGIVFQSEPTSLKPTKQVDPEGMVE